MMNKKFLLGAVFFVSSILFIGNVFAFSCKVDTTDDCDVGAKGVVMSLSSISNAHGEKKDGGGDYLQHVCCDFEGTDNCVGSNALGISLSGITNAHAELTGGVGGYSEEICFGALDCVVADSGDCDVTGENSEGYDLEMVSLSDSTNAHLGKFSEYGTKICCKWQANAYWVDAISGEEKTIANIGDTVKLVLNNSGLDVGVGVYNNFIIEERDTLNDDEIRNDNSIVGDVDVEFVLSGIWEITQDDYEAARDEVPILGYLDSTPDEFFFTANGIKSSYLEIVSTDESIAFCGEYTEENTCATCSNHIDCQAAYNSANNLSKDIFEVECGGVLLDDENYKTNCFCGWDVEKDECGPGVSAISIDIITIAPHCKNNVQDEDEDETGVDCGGDDCSSCDAPEHCFNDTKDYFGEGNVSNEEGIDCGGLDCVVCNYVISFPSIGSWEYFSEDWDDCDDGFLEYSWTSEWTWGADNNFSLTEVENNDFSSDVNDYIKIDNRYYYDPQRLSEKSSEGYQTIPCPAQIELPFFGFFGVVFSLILISFIYGFLIFYKKK